MKNNDMYTFEQVESIAEMTAKRAVEQLLHLENNIELLQTDEMSRLKQQVNVNGIQKWITGKTMQDMFNAYLNLCLQQGVVAPPIAVKAETNHVPLFGKYISAFNQIYKSKQESLTKESRKRITEKHIIPKWGHMALDKIRTSDIQLWFNELEEKGYSHETLLKLKNNMSPVFDAAVEDGYISRNPLKSTRLKIGGRETKHHQAIATGKMQEIRSSIPLIENKRIKYLLILLCYTGMRLEEILGLRWEDFNLEDNWIYVQRAVIHPKRNMPEVKEPKTKTSKRKIPLTSHMKSLFGPVPLTGYVLESKTEGPLSYTEVRHCMDKIKKMFSITNSAHDFRDTCATEWREAGIPMDIIARLLGHAKTEVTESRYIKYRDEVFSGVRQVMEEISGTETGTN